MDRAPARSSHSSPSANPYEKRGLAPGIGLTIYPTPGIASEALPTIVEFVSADRVEVLVPIRQRRLRPLQAGSIVEAEFRHGRRTRRFLAEVVGHSGDGSHEILGKPGFIDIPERRSSFRLETTIIPGALALLPPVVDGEPEGRPQPISGVLLDLSDGGVCLSSPAAVKRGDRLAVTLELGELGTITPNVEVLGIEDLGKGRRNRKIHCRFVELARRDRERIARYVMRRQIEMRSMGRL